MTKASALGGALTKSGAKVAASAPEPPAPAQSAPPSQPSRAGKVAITVHFEEPVRRQLKVLASEHGRLVEDMVAEALNLLFVQYGKPEIAPRK